MIRGETLITFQEFSIYSFLSIISLSEDNPFPYSMNHQSIVSLLFKIILFFLVQVEKGSYLYHVLSSKREERRFEILI